MMRNQATPFPRSEFNGVAPILLLILLVAGTAEPRKQVIVDDGGGHMTTAGCPPKESMKFAVHFLGRRPWTISFGARNEGELLQRTRFDGDLATIPWFERMLTYNTVEFVADAPETGKPTSPTVAGPARTSPTKPMVQELNVAAVPTQSRKG